jgi:SAM-dependent methyltransferase
MTSDIPFENAGNLEKKRSKPYQALAPIYNHVMKHVDYESWAKYIDTIIQKLTIEPDVILDVGCGSGKFIKEMVTLGYRMQGCDPSPDMLVIAKSKNPDVHFWKDGLPDMENTRQSDYQLITCLYDTFNYLQDLKEVEKSLNRLSQLLRDDGYVIFDVVSQKFCQLYFDDASEEEVINHNYAYSRESYFLRKTAQQINKFIIYSPAGIFEEIHVQKIFAFQKLKSMIEQRSPFHIEAVYDDFSFHPAGDNSDRAHFILKKVGND